jgi:hypothetical protein
MCTGELKVKSRTRRCASPIKRADHLRGAGSEGPPDLAGIAPALRRRGPRRGEKGFDAMIAKLGGIKPGDPFPDHPAFGVLSHRAYGVLLAKHTEHHFQQFGLW